MFKKEFPGLSEWVGGWGWIEIGQDEESRSLVRIIDEGGMIWESPDKSKDLDKTLQTADDFIRKWFEENE
jgi:hypothetical protein